MPNPARHWHIPPLIARRQPDSRTAAFYRRAGYQEYAVKYDYPPGHSNHFLRKDL